MIEAMNLGLIPVVTDTGFARDLITDGQDGYIVSTSATAEEFIQGIRNASNLNANLLCFLTVGNA